MQWHGARPFDSDHYLERKPMANGSTARLFVFQRAREEYRQQRDRFEAMRLSEQDYVRSRLIDAGFSVPSTSELDVELDDELDEQPTKQPSCTVLSRDPKGFEVGSSANCFY